MKKQILISAVSIFILVLIAGTWTAESHAAEKLDLRLRLKPGQKYDMRLITELKRSETIKGKQENESFTFAKGIGFEVKEVDTNGVASIEVTFRTLQMKVIRAGGVHVEYDSTKQSIADDYSKIPVIQAAGIGESFVMKVTPKGKIIELKGIEQMHSRMAKKIMRWDDEFLSLPIKTNKGWKEGWKERWEELRRHNTKSTYSEKEIKNMLSDMITAFPDRPLAIGDSWTDKVKIWGKNEEIDGTYTLKDTKKGTVTVDLSAKRTTEEELFSWVNNEGREVGFKIVGSYEGSFEIDQKTGWLVRSKVKKRFTGRVIDEKANDQVTKPILEEEVITVEPMG